MYQNVMLPIYVPGLIIFFTVKQDKIIKVFTDIVCTNMNDKKT